MSAGCASSCALTTSRPAEETHHPRGQRSRFPVLHRHPRARAMRSLFSTWAFHWNEGKSRRRKTMKIRRLLTCFLLLAVTLMAASAMAQPPVTFKFADVKAKGAIQTDSYAVNNAGVIAGDYIDSSNVQHGLILNKAVVTSFDG